MRLEDNVLFLDRELSLLDKKVISFVKILERQDVDHVIVSGYWAILTGRSRGTEDVDVLVEGMGEDEVSHLVSVLLNEGYWCLNAGSEQVYGHLNDGIAVRFADEGEVIPNFEVKFADDSFDESSLRNPVFARVGDEEIRLGSLEIQIAYKLFLGSEKDFEDALHLYTLFRENIDEDALERYVKELDVQKRYDELRGA